LNPSTTAIPLIPSTPNATTDTFSIATQNTLLTATQAETTPFTSTEDFLSSQQQGYGYPTPHPDTQLIYPTTTDPRARYQFNAAVLRVFTNELSLNAAFTLHFSNLELFPTNKVPNTFS